VSVSQEVERGPTPQGQPPPSETGATAKKLAEDSVIQAAADAVVELDADELAEAVASWRQKQWNRAAAEAIDELAAIGDFTVDHLLDRIGLPPVIRQISSAFAAGKRRGVIVRSGSTLGRDGRLVYTWCGADHG
jgi:hypothetical protein